MFHSLPAPGVMGRPRSPEHLLHAIESHTYICPTVIALEQFPLRVPKRDMNHTTHRSTRLLAVPIKLDSKLSLRLLLGF